MRQALIDARLPPSAIDHVNCHATSTPLGDQAELTALLQLLSNSSDFQTFAETPASQAFSIKYPNSPKPEVSLTASKSQLAHTISAAGAIESMIAVLSLDTGIVPGTINLDDPEPMPWTLPETPVELYPRVALKNAFAFGGINCSVLFEKAHS